MKSVHRKELYDMKQVLGIHGPISEAPSVTDMALTFLCETPIGHVTHISNIEKV
jgi:hypothetical protein